MNSIEPRYRIFTLQEANDMIPLLESIFKKHLAGTEKIMKEQRYFLRSGAPEKRIKECDEKVTEAMKRWGGKLLRLGVKALDFGYVGFDTGEFFYSWKAGETEITHYHHYMEHPLSRRPLPRHNPLLIEAYNGENKKTT